MKKKILNVKNFSKCLLYILSEYLQYFQIVFLCTPLYWLDSALQDRSCVLCFLDWQNLALYLVCQGLSEVERSSFISGDSDIN